MGQTDLSSNSLISHPDVFADIINAIIYEGRQVLDEKSLKPYYNNSSTAKGDSRLKGLYRDSCMEDVRNGVRYVIWGVENQYVPDYTAPFKVMGYDYAAYDRQIEEYTTKNKKDKNEAYVKVLHPEQKLKPVITLMLYYGTENIPKSIHDMLDIPKDDAVRKYIQNYSLNLIKLREFTNEEAERFRSDFACIAKFLQKSYNKEEQIKMLREDKQILIHTKDTLYTLASITGDKRYLQIGNTSKEGTAMCEVADAFVTMGIKQGIEEGKLQGIKQGIEEGKLQGIKQGIEQGKLQGIKQGIEQGIKSIIETCKEFNIKKDDTLSKISEKFDLDQQKAQYYMDKYWK